MKLRNLSPLASFELFFSLICHMKKNLFINRIFFLCIVPAVPMSILRKEERRKKSTRHHWMINGLPQHLGKKLKKMTVAGSSMLLSICFPFAILMYSWVYIK